jgi:3-hydroxybutyryl-CoA dehydrogenase
MSAFNRDSVVAVVGAGSMGAGIAQVCASAGHPVLFYDAMDGSAERARDGIGKSLQALVAKGRTDAADAKAVIDRIKVATTLEDLGGAGLCIEAITENLAIKQQVFQALEAHVGPDTILASNTSSLSISAIAMALNRPQRFLGVHFFNPASVMKLVEIVSAAATDPAIAALMFDMAKAWGKIPVMCKSTPGFIVNRVARPFYGEALRVLEEGLATPATIDALITACGGFRMGPFELMDLIGHDVNFAVTRSVFDGYFQDPRYRPSLVQKELVDAGWFGRKSGRGFYSYADNTEKPCAVVWLHSGKPYREAPGIRDGKDILVGDVLIGRTDGRTAAARALERGGPVVLYDLMLDPAQCRRIGLAASPEISESDLEEIIDGLVVEGFEVSVLRDLPGLIVMRTIAMLVNEAFEAVLQGVADAGAIDLAMRFGVNYPHGPFEFAEKVGIAAVLGVMEALHEATGDMRYRPSFGLRQAVETQCISQVRSQNGQRRLVGVDGGGK